MLNKRKLIAFRVSPSLWSALKALAKEQDITVARLAERMLARQLERHVVRALREK